ncbi:MAG: DUF5060 domain-containing protein [Candidatus Eisenbacteria bacterium]|uniref:DUF5060 domain-containing protein n=1 Tax=Eiseniibacteriota bacterium TaxID=2212470 RepID=A0A948W211_UNCEI|nr:DUF5060 domain-containing protein [Candidatus Eisenbacteria bacterium]MBU1949212.1 DUF5060 domain-containing protein [Candidatus Eisenbacteria bacterium]MBU2689437.1 DUF5060 domain-containing protein [Candidatus Eisenbacteria bacterium]
MALPQNVKIFRRPLSHRPVSAGIAVWRKLSLPILSCLLSVGGCLNESGVDPSSYPYAADGKVSFSESETLIVPRYGTVDIILHSEKEFKAKGDISPFTDINVQAVVWTPGGRRFHVDGFFDGDGAGGSNGHVFKIRLCPDTEGWWSWEILSGLSELHGKGGRILCRGSLPGLFARGPIIVHPKHSRFFSTADGTPLYLMAKFLDEAAPEPIQFSHTFFSEQVIDADREEMLARHRRMKCNRLDIYLANRGDYGGIQTTPWSEKKLKEGQVVFNLSYWRMYEHWLRRLRDADMAAHIWFFADDSDFGKLPLEQRLELIRYGMARLSGFVNTIFVVCLEWEEGWSRKEVEVAGRVTQEANPWSRLVSVHGTPGDFDYPESDWADYLIIQPGNKADYDSVYTLGLTNRGAAAKPLLNEEFSLGGEDDAGRIKAWCALFAGGAGSGTGAFLPPLSDFISAVPYTALEPLAGMVVRGKAYLLGERGRELLAYLPEGDEVEINLHDFPGIWRVTWFDPRKGDWTALDPVPGGATQLFRPLGEGDWALRLVP